MHTPNDTLAIRPRFQEYVTISRDDLLLKFREALAIPETGVKGSFMEHHLTLKIPREEQHFWSPQLQLELEQQEDGLTLIRGLYGPRPTVWLMFLFFYALLGFIAMIITIIGFSEVNLGLPGRILWVLPIVGGVAIFMFLSARAGQRLGQAEMVRLHHFFEQVAFPGASPKSALHE